MGRTFREDLILLDVFRDFTIPWQTSFGHLIIPAKTHFVGESFDAPDSAIAQKLRSCRRRWEFLYLFVFGNSFEWSFCKLICYIFPVHLGWFQADCKFCWLENLFFGNVSEWNFCKPFCWLLLVHLGWFLADLWSKSFFGISLSPLFFGNVSSLQLRGSCKTYFGFVTLSSLGRLWGPFWIGLYQLVLRANPILSRSRRRFGTMIIKVTFIIRR